MKPKRWRDRVGEDLNLRRFFLLCGVILFYVVITNLGKVWDGVQFVLGILMPVLAAFFITFLLYPVVSFLEFKVLGRLKHRRGLHALCAIFTMVFLVVVLVLLLYLLLNQVATSAAHFLENFDSYLNGLGALIRRLFGPNAMKLELFGVTLEEFLNTESSNLQTIGSQALSWLSQHAEGIFGGAVSLGSNIFNIFITVMLSIYMLLDIEHLKRSFGRFFQAYMEPERYKRVTDISKRSGKIFLRYFGSNLLDALIIGAMMYLFMIIAGLPYALLIAVVIGVTNLVPTFGPIVGAVVGGFLILLVNPLGTIWFVIYSIVSQFIDANVIKPKLFGDTTGLRPMWVLASIIIGGALFGVVGMLLGVPIFAIIAMLLNERVEKRNQRWAENEETSKEAVDEKKEPQEEA